MFYQIKAAPARASSGDTRGHIVVGKPSIGVTSQLRLSREHPAAPQTRASSAAAAPHAARYAPAVLRCSLGSRAPLVHPPVPRAHTRRGSV